MLLILITSSGRLEAGGVVDTDQVVGVTGEEISAISRPCEAGAVRDLRVLAYRGNIKLDLVDHALGLQVPDLDALGGGGAQPISVGREHKGVDDVTSLKRVESLALGKVPEHGSTVLATGSAKGSIGGDGHGVEVSVVADKVGAELAVGERPDLDESVPASGHDNGGSRGGRESHARHPLGVALLDNGELALTKSVPKLDGSVTRSRHDLTVVSAESHGEDVLGVANKSAGAAAGVDVPKTEGGIPRAGEGELAIGRDDNVRHEVVVATKRSASISVISILSGKGPHNHSLISGRRQDHGRILSGGGDGSHPSRVTGQSSAKSKLFSHY
jgi:hypothetical protein